MSLTILSMDATIDGIIASKSLREWRKLANAEGVSVGKYVDGIILSFITRQYDRGIITVSEFNEIRKRWGV